MNVKEWGVTNRTAEIEESILLAELKLWMRIRHAHEDSLIAMLRTAAVEYSEEYCRMFLVRTTAERSISNFSGSSYILDGVHIAGVTVLDASNIAIPFTIIPMAYGVEIKFTEPLTDKLIKVTFTSGFANVPVSLVTTFMYIINSMYVNRENSVERLPTFVSNKLAPYKIFKVA